MSSLKAYKELIKQNPDSVHPILDSPQQEFTRSKIREVGYGGEAGGAKSYGLVLCPLYQLHKEDYHAILFRRTYKQLSGDDGLIDLSKTVYPFIGGRYIKSEYRWEFSNYPGTIRFAHLEHENVLEQDYEGHQYAFIGWDELQTFSERMYLYMFSRNRSSNPEVDLYTRSTFMPGGIGHHFVKKRFITPFLNGDRYSSKSKKFIRVDGIDTETDHKDAIERKFIPAKLEDNPYLWRDGNSDYERGLKQLDTVDYRRKKGDWDIRRTGLVYHAFNNTGPLSTELDYSQAEGYWHGHDFGAVNRAWLLFVRIKGIYYLIHEEILPAGTTAARATKIKTHFVNRKIVAGYGGTKSESQQIIDYYKEGVKIRVPIVSSVEGQIDKVNKMLEDGTMKICSDMTLTVDQLENCIRDIKEQIQDKSTWHFLDCLRYFCAGVSSKGWAR